MVAHRSVLVLVAFLVVIVATAVQATGEPQEWQAFIERSAKVVAEQDGVLRNYQISQSYYELGVMLQQLFGTTVEKGNPQGNWPTMGAWASNSAGMSIRGTTLPDAVWLKFHDHLPKWLIQLLQVFPNFVSAIFSFILRITSAYLAEGNKVVFAEVGGTLARFGLYFANVTHPDEGRWHLYQSTFNVSDPLDALLLNASRAYYKAMWVSGKPQAEYILLGNLLIGLAEQTRLQPYIYASMQNNRSIEFPVPGGKKITLNEAAVITQSLITLVLSNEVLYCGADLTPAPDGKAWPADLKELQNTELRDVYTNLVGQTETLAGTAAHNWVQLDQRMRYISALFRSRQSDESLVTCPPFTQEQVTQIWQGIKPKDTCLATCCNNA